MRVKQVKEKSKLEQNLKNAKKINNPKPEKQEDNKNEEKAVNLQDSKPETSAPYLLK